MVLAAGWRAMGDPLERLGKLRCLAIGRGVSVMATATWLDNAEDVRGAAALVFIVAACDLARRHRNTGSHRSQAVAPAVRPGRPLALVDRPAGSECPTTSSIRWTYSWSSFGTHHIFFRHGFSSWLVNNRRIVSRPTLATSPRRLSFMGRLELPRFSRRCRAW